MNWSFDSRGRSASMERSNEVHAFDYYVTLILLIDEGTKLL